jgi:hypothetical protein
MALSPARLTFWPVWPAITCGNWPLHPMLKSPAPKHLHLLLLLKPKHPFKAKPKGPVAASLARPMATPPFPLVLAVVNPKGHPLCPANGLRSALLALQALVVSLLPIHRRLGHSMSLDPLVEAPVRVRPRVVGRVASLVLAVGGNRLVRLQAVGVKPDRPSRNGNGFCGKNAERRPLKLPKPPHCQRAQSCYPAR